MGEKMTNAQAAEILRQHNAWRRGNDDEMPDAPVNPTRLGMAIDHAVAHLTQPAQAVDVDAIAPRSWLDPMLTGPTAVIGTPPYDCKDIERVLNEVRKRLTAALPNANGKEGIYMASCGKPLCNENDHHPLCNAIKGTPDAAR